MNIATLENLRRKSTYVDAVQLHDGIPLFSWIDINPTELCNRTCVFCPRNDPGSYPNQNLHISLALIDKIAEELKQLNYRGAIAFSGFGEPLLHPHIVEVASRFGKAIRLEIITNGDKLTPDLIHRLVEAGVDYFVISMYDGPFQRDHFNRMFEAAGCPPSYYILRDRWHTEEDGYGLKLTNRAGTVNVGKQDPVDITLPCYYTIYSMTLDWNGDALLCVQDWNKRVKLGNVYAQSLLEIWQSDALMKFRRKLAKGKRVMPPCDKCNTSGTLHGFNHLEAWQQSGLLEK